MLTYDIVKYLGAYWAISSPLDAIVFTGGMGENAFYLRKKVIDSLKHFGVKLDVAANRKNELVISSKASKLKVFVIPTNEELMIAKESYALLKN
jgi:acetate kinase